MAHAASITDWQAHLLRDRKATSDARHAHAHTDCVISCGRWSTLTCVHMDRKDVFRDVPHAFAPVRLQLSSVRHSDERGRVSCHPAATTSVLTSVNAGFCRCCCCYTLKAAATPERLHWHSCGCSPTPCLATQRCYLGFSAGDDQEIISACCGKELLSACGGKSSVSWQSISPYPDGDAASQQSLLAELGAELAAEHGADGGSRCLARCWCMK